MPVRLEAGGGNWRALFRRRGFRFLFAAMFISLFGTGLNYAGVTWWVLEQTGSTVRVSFIVILVALPGLFVPPFGGVLIDRVDRRYLGVTLDLARAAVVLATAALVWTGVAGLAHILAMVFVLGIGFAVYWSTANALVQEVVETPDLVGANALVLIAIQGGMMTGGALFGLLYRHVGLAGILAIDGLTYLLAAVLLLALRSGRRSPRTFPEEPPPTIEAPAPAPREEAVLPPIFEPGVVMGFLADLREGLRYLRLESRVFLLGVTYACMMAGVLSANVLIVALARNILAAGEVGYGWMQAGWALGAIVGGFASGLLVRRFRPGAVLLVALGLLAVGHAMFPYVRYLALAVAMHAVFGGCRALGSVLTQSAIMTTVPRRLMGRTQSAFAVIATLLQVVMSFTLGWLAQEVNIEVAFLVLGALYAASFAAALRARSTAA
jgi:MFS transporter, DHA3 family, macrolide efflux protein